MSSLQSRFTKATIALLVLFSLLLAGLLDRIFHHTLITSEENRLKGVVYTFLSAMDVSSDGQVKIDRDSLPDTLTQTKDLSIFVLNQGHQTIWSMEDRTYINTNMSPRTGEWQFERDSKNNHPLYLSFGVAWESDNPSKDWTYSILVIDSGKFYANEMKSFRNTLWIWLILASTVLLLLQLAVLRWGFRPLSQIATEVALIEKGKQHKFENQYPSELTPLTTNINSLLRHERSQQMRYQQALDNLAHALKTPLTAIKNMTMNKNTDQTVLKELDEHVMRAKDIVDYQLRKAATVGKNPFAKKMQLQEVVEKISRSIQKVYAQKNVEMDIHVPTEITVQMDEGDLFEIVGNIIENAAKYCTSKIRITVSENQSDLIIEDDGPGFSDATIQSLVQRGVRQDQRIEGSGIGLSVAYEIISVFGGSLELTRSPSLGGALVKIRFS